MDNYLARCRICLNEEGIMFNIFKKTHEIMISTKIMAITKVRIHPGDGFPALICSICISKLNDCIQFIKMCEVSDSKLRTSHSFYTKEENNLEARNFCNGSDNKNMSAINVENTNGSKDVREKTALNNLSDNSNEECNGSFNRPRKCNYKRKEIKIRQQCNICGRVMSSRHRLKTHLVTHTGERPYTCPICPKKFSLEANLKVHLRIHTGEKPFRCSVCQETFAQSSGLIAHKRKHTGLKPYKCLLCPQSFRTIGHLQYHTKRHTGEKNFECEKCGRAFITRSDLNQHLSTHSGDRRHVCSVCGLRLTRASNLKRHILQLHNAASVTVNKDTESDLMPNVPSE